MTHRSLNGENSSAMSDKRTRCSSLNLSNRLKKPSKLFTVALPHLNQTNLKLTLILSSPRCPPHSTPTSLPPSLLLNLHPKSRLQPAPLVQHPRLRWRRWCSPQKATNNHSRTSLHHTAPQGTRHLCLLRPTRRSQSPQSPVSLQNSSRRIRSDTTFSEKPKFLLDHVTFLP